MKIKTHNIVALIVLLSLAACGKDSEKLDSSEQANTGQTSDAVDDTDKTFKFAEGAYNVDEFDVRGVTFTDTHEQVIQKLSEYYSLNPADFKVEWKDEPKDGYNTKEIIREMSFENENYHFTLYFNPSKEDPNITLLDSFYIEKRGGLATEKAAYMQIVLDEAIEKYGPPTTSNKNADWIWQNYWCAEKHPERSGCTSYRATLEISDDTIFFQKTSDNADIIQRQEEAKTNSN